MGKGVQKLKTSRYKINKLYGDIYRYIYISIYIATILNNNVLYI